MFSRNNWAILVKESTTTSIVLWPLEQGKSVTKSRETTAQGLGVVNRG